MISDQITKVARETGSLHDTSFFTLTFTDDSTVTEKDVNWSDVSEELDVDMGGVRKTVYVCKFPVKHIRIDHADLVAEVDVPDGCQVYQAFRSRTTLSSDGQSADTIVGRAVGIVENGVVTEERYIDVLGAQVLGFKK